MQRRDQALGRRSSLADIMVLVGATGAGLAMLRPYFAAFSVPYLRNTSRSLRVTEATYGAWSCLAACWMIALIFLQGRGTRPARGRLARRPGYVACCAAAVALAAGAMELAVKLAFREPRSYSTSFYSSWITLTARVSPAVAGAWVLLALSGRWRADTGWIDRLGRLLGCCWVGWSFFWLLPDSARARLLWFWDGVLS